MAEGPRGVDVDTLVARARRGGAAGACLTKWSSSQASVCAVIAKPTRQY